MSLLCQIEMTLPRMFREVPGVTVRLMSDKELARLEVLRDLDQRRLTPAAAAQLPGLERRQIFRLLKVALIGFRGDGGASHDQSRNEGTKKSFAPAAGVVHELEEAEIQRQLLLRDAPVWPQPGA